MFSLAVTELSPEASLDVAPCDSMSWWRMTSPLPNSEERHGRKKSHPCVLTAFQLR